MPVKLQCFYVPFKTGVIKTKNVTLHRHVLMHHVGFPCHFSAKAYNFGKLLCATCFTFSLSSTFGQEQVQLISELVCLMFFLL